ncbi:MAG: hypothetical protein ACRCZO_16545, partial [Cetobacterium sp.]
MRYNDAALKDLFNCCLDEHLPQCVMEGLRSVDFWRFAAFLSRRRERASQSHPHTGTEAVTSVNVPAHESISEGTGEVGTEPQLHPGKGRRRRRKKA